MPLLTRPLALILALAAALVSSEARADQSGDERPPQSTGFHISLGAGLSGDGQAGIASQFKIGARLSPKFRVYYHALNHYFSMQKRTTMGSLSATETEWRIRAINGVGLDYFMLPGVGLRLSAGLGGDTSTSLGKDPKAFGYSYVLGMTIDLMGGDSHLSIDPFIHMFQYNQRDLGSLLPSDWVNLRIIGVTLNWNYR